MAANLSSEQSLKHLRELCPNNGKDIPDEFIVRILESCGNDLDRSCEELLERLSRASWESVEKGKKKKAEKPQNGHASANDRRRAPTSGKYEGRSNGFHGKDDTSSSQRGRNSGLERRAPTIGSKNIVRSEKSASRSVPPIAATPVAPSDLNGAVQHKPVDPSPALPCTNQWAKGRPQVIAAPEKKSVTMPQTVPSTNVPQYECALTVPDQDDTLDLQTSVLVEGVSVESSQTDDTLPEELRTQEVVNPSKTNQAPQASDDQGSSEIIAAEDSVQNSSISSSADAVEGSALQFDNLKVEDIAAQQETSTHTIQAPASSLESMASTGSHSVPAGNSQLQDVYASQSSFSQYNMYQNQFQPPHQQFSSMQDSSFNAHKMYYNPAVDGSQTSMNMDAANRSGMSFAGKGAAPSKQQSQQQNWQSPMMNSYGMMTPNMYMTPQQMQLMYMQSYGMGMGYGTSGQMYNSVGGYPQQNNFTAKGQFSHPGSHKKPAGYGGSFGQQGFAATSYAPAVARAEDQFKYRSSQGAENFDGNYSYPYPSMGFSLDGGIQSQGFPAAARCSNTAGTTNGMPADESPYFSRGPYFGQVDGQGQSQGQWIGGN